MIPDTPLFDKAAFVIPDGVTHVCAGGESAPLRRHEAAVAAYLRDKASGMAGRDAQEALIERVRSRVGRTWNVPAADVGFVSNVAEGISMLVESLDWTDGGEICVEADEYPSVVAPILRSDRTAPRLRIARGRGPDRLLEAIGPRTRLVAVSYVSYLNGERFDLTKLRARADEVGAILVVDYTQAAGSLPIDASLADFAFSACYKWLLGVTGCAIAVWNRTRQPEWSPSTAGWYSLAPDGRPDYGAALRLRDDGLRFTRGNPSHISLYILDEALAFLARHPPNDVGRHVQSLAGALRDGLVSRGIEPSTPADPARHGASICVAGAFDPGLPAALQRRGVYLWGNRGRLRVSFHGYNDATDVERLLDELPRAMSR